MDIFREVDSINFGVLSAEEIIKMSVCELNSSTLSGNGSVYDPRMGFCSDNTEKSCVTCNLNYEGCPGHYGHICLPEPVYHPNQKFFKMIGSFLKCFCFKCNNILISYDQLVVNNFHKYKRNNRFEKILEKLKKDNTCINPDCKITQPKVALDHKDRSIKLTYKTTSKTIEIPLSPRDIYKIFDSISNEDVTTLGFDPRFIHPRNLIINVLPVIPPCSRPTVVTASAICDDDLTSKYIEIIKYVKKYSKKLEEEKAAEDTEKNKLLKSIEFHISTLFDNSKGLSKHSTNMKPTSSFRDRMAGKNALIRSNLMGKRCNQTARTVIGPDPTLRMGQLAVPFEIATNLTIPETVTSFNKEFLMNIINSGKANYVIRKENKKRINLNYALVKHGTRLMYGDIIVRDGKEIRYIEQAITLKPGDQIRRCGEMIPVEFDQKRKFTIEEGDIVERQFRNGDLVLLNRQPTLHRGSMIAKEVVIMPYKTLRFNLSCTKSFNADFDGDEMNIHAGQTLEGRAELMELSASKHNLMSAQSSKPNIVIVQDSLLGAYKMTKSTNKIPKSDFFNIINNVIQVDGTPMSPKEILFRINHIRKILKLKGKKVQALNGKGIFSFTLPLDFNYESKNEADSEEPIVRIFKGVLYEGVINKTDIGSSSNSIIQCLYKEYGKDITATFIDNVQFITNSWLTMAGFTVGIKDCIAKKTEEISNVVEKCFIEASTIAETTHHPGVREARINASLSKARDTGLKVAKESMDKNNNFMSTIMAGSKGDVFNIAQITGLLGQQNIDGQRIPKHISNGTRTLPHYPFGKLSNDMEYESRGFIRSSFIKGLNPREFYLHAMTGRSGIVDTSTGTARSGYIQRRVVKLTEDIGVQYDGTVRNLDKNIYEFVYADCGLDTGELIVKNGKSLICNISRMVDRMNTACEK
jgi:DNA-directed RNA polymerase beta' subunit